MGSYDSILMIIPYLGIIVFVFVFCFVIVTMVINLIRWSKNNHSPVLIVEAKLIAKRTNVRRGVRTPQHTRSTTTTYYVSFEFESGDRIEFAVDGSEYGIIVEGDVGKLKFQGTRYLGFERTKTTKP